MSHDGMDEDLVSRSKQFRDDVENSSGCTCVSMCLTIRSLNYLTSDGMDEDLQDGRSTNKSRNQKQVAELHGQGAQHTIIHSHYNTFTRFGVNVLFSRLIRVEILRKSSSSNFQAKSAKSSCHNWMLSKWKDLWTVLIHMLML